MNEIDADIKSGAYKKAYLIYGEEVYMVKQYAQELKNAVVDSAMELMNLNTFEGRADVDSIINACDTLPFMAERRFVMIKDSKLFEAGRKDDTEKLKEYIANSPDTTVICFIENKVDKRNALYKAVDRVGICKGFAFLKDNELISFVVDKSKGAIKPNVAEHLIKNVGTAMEALDGEIDKLLNYAGSDEITIELVDSICTKSPETNVFEMVDAIGRKQSAKALEIYNNMLRMKLSPVYVLKTMSRQFKLILQCKYLHSKGYGATAIAEELSIRKFIVDRCLQQAKNFKMATLAEALEDCVSCDTNFKSGKITDKLGVEVIILKYSRS